MKGFMGRSVVVLALLCAGCGWFGSSPKKVVGKYLDAIAAGKHEKAYALVSARDQAARKLEAFSAAAPSDPLTRAAAAGYEMGEVSEEGEKARVSVTLKGGVAEGAPAGGEPRAAQRTFRVIKEEGDWKLFLGWEAEALVAEARALVEQGRLQEALDKYAQAASSDPDSMEAADGVTGTERAIRIAGMEQEYMLNNVEVVGFRATKGTGRGGASVTGRLLNNGHRTLSLVEVTVQFLSASDSVVAERTFRPIPTTELMYKDEERSLHKGGLKEFGFIVDGALPREWTGKARAFVTKIQFEERT
jgi:tetratricopeptide (TPR) repeat protein